MEIDITQFFLDACPRDYSASIAEIGQDAAKSTWQAACDDAEDYAAFLDTEEKRDAFRDHLRGFGAWDDDEIAAYSQTELTALFMQMVSGDMRDASLDAIDPDWDDYERGAERGTYSGRICRAGSGDEFRVYYYLGD